MFKNWIGRVECQEDSICARWSILGMQPKRAFRRDSLWAKRIEINLAGASFCLAAALMMMSLHEKDYNSNKLISAFHMIGRKEFLESSQQQVASLSLLHFKQNGSAEKIRLEPGERPTIDLADLWPSFSQSSLMAFTFVLNSSGSSEQQSI